MLLRRALVAGHFEANISHNLLGGLHQAAQAHYLTERFLDRQARDFEEQGGFSERLHKARTKQKQPHKD